VRFDLDSDLHQGRNFYSFPYPSDVRLTAQGTPDLVGLPNFNAVALVEGLRTIAMERKGFPVIPTAYFTFSSPVGARDSETLIAAASNAPVILVDVDPLSDERGRLFPTVAHTPAEDDYVPQHMVSVAARPGFILKSKRTYAFVILRNLGDGNGNPLGVPLALQQLKAGVVPSGARGAAVQALYAPLWDALRLANVSVDDVAAATVFTTGDVVQDLFDFTERVKAAHQPAITGLHLDADDGTTHERFCELHGTIPLPQFQRGTPPYNTEGLFDVGADGLPAVQSTLDVPVTITIPKREMPAGGYPLVQYIHGSGGTSRDVVDYGPSLTADGLPIPKLGPAHTVGFFGIASASSAMPVNPERLQGASDTAYLNLANAPAFRDTFRQGVIEQRLYAEALKKLRLDPSLLAGCTGPSLPGGETQYRFSQEKFMLMGQSMGGMYTNLTAAVEPRVKLAVPTGAGGYWSYFILKTSLIENVAGFLSLALGTLEPLTFMHPAMNVMETAWEPAEPVVFMPRIARDPLPGHPARPIYEPVGRDDSYFPTVVYDTIALAYGHSQAGAQVWPTMQQSLALDGFEGMLNYPVSNNLTSTNGSRYTGVVVQYEGDGFYDPHAIYRQLDAVKSQIGCFMDSWLKTGTATVSAPHTLGTACP